MDGWYQPKPGEYVPPERHVVLLGDANHGLRLLPEPIAETLKREREEQAA